MNADLFAILMSWTASLSGYSAPEVLPEVQFVDHEFFVEHACYGKECRVEGWYADTGIVYIDKKHDVPTHDERSWFSRSLIVHEFSHHLQHLSGKFDDTCESYVAREKEAYRVQYRFVQEAMHRIELVRPKMMECSR